MISSLFLAFSLPPGLTWTLVVLTVVTAICSMVVLPIVVVRMEEDYFLEDRNPRNSMSEAHPVIRWIGLIGKNVLGVILLIAGIIMLVTPGQGLLTVLMGLALTDFPNKRKLELRIVSIPAVYKAINWIRRKANQPPLRLPGQRVNA